jgi:hypothetical protein
MRGIRKSLLREILVLALFGVLLTFAGPPLAGGIRGWFSYVRETWQLGQQERYRRTHPPPLESPLAAPKNLRAVEAILRAASARSVRVYRVGPFRGEPRERNGATAAIPVDGVEWGRRFLRDVLLGTRTPSGETLKPSFLVRFLAASDTIEFDLSTLGGPAPALVRMRWREGSVWRQLGGRMPWVYEGPVGADSTIQLLRPRPPSHAPVIE